MADSDLVTLVRWRFLERTSTIMPLEWSFVEAHLHGTHQQHPFSAEESSRGVYPKQHPAVDSQEIQLAFALLRQAFLFNLAHDYGVDMYS